MRALQAIFRATTAAADPRTSQNTGDKMTDTMDTPVLMSRAVREGLQQPPQAERTDSAVRTKRGEWPGTWAEAGGKGDARGGARASARARTGPRTQERTYRPAPAARRPSRVDKPG